VRSQHHRHRTWSYNEISRRYTEVDLNFYEPLEFRTQHKSNRQASNIDDTNDPIIESLYADDDITHMFASEAVKEHHLESLELFNKLLEAGVCREQARGVLPQNLYTQYYGSCNLSNLLKFIDLRLHEGAQWEIQKMAHACLEIVTDLFPITVSTYRELRGHGNDE
jgi:thymidylate synthase (FAD)